MNATLKKRPVMSVAPMMAWTDRHCRYLYRNLTQKTLLYTEMITASALIHGDVHKHLRFDEIEHPIALQLGGSDPHELAIAARIAQSWGYDEINLNCGCPSPRVQKGAFGACLMLEPAIVAEAIKAMKDAVDIEVSVKHRIGIGRFTDDAGLLTDFVGQVHEAGCDVFIVHARNAWLEGLSPKDNREIPPLCYERVYRLKKEFPHLHIVLNGGVDHHQQIQEHLLHVDGVMVGRGVYHTPLWLAQWDALYHAQASFEPDLDAIEDRMLAYMEKEYRCYGTPWHTIATHMLGLRHGQVGARAWRRVWSDHRLYDQSAAKVREIANRARVETKTGESFKQGI